MRETIALPDEGHGQLFALIDVATGSAEHDTICADREDDVGMARVIEL